jgi:hypothetical protein
MSHCNLHELLYIQELCIIIIDYTYVYVITYSNRFIGYSIQLLTLFIITMKRVFIMEKTKSEKEYDQYLKKLQEKQLAISKKKNSKVD